VNWLMSKALSKQIGSRLPKGLSAKRLSAADLQRIKSYWLERELRSETSWREFQKIYDANRIFSVDSRSKGVELPVSITPGTRESIVLLFRSASSSRERPSFATFTITQTGAQGTLVGGSTFVIKPMKGE